jgi:cell division protein FtsB
MKEPQHQILKLSELAEKYVTGSVSDVASQQGVEDRDDVDEWVEPTRDEVSQVHGLETTELSEELGRSRVMAYLAMEDKLRGRPDHTQDDTLVAEVKSTPEHEELDDVDELEGQDTPRLDEPVVSMPGDVQDLPRTSTSPRAETIVALSRRAGRSPAFVDEHVVELDPRHKGGSPTAYRTARVPGDDLESFRTEIGALRKTAAETDKHVNEIASALKEMRSVVDGLRRSNDALTKERDALKSENAALRKEAGVEMGRSPGSTEREALARTARSILPEGFQRALGVDERAVTGRVRDNGNDMER